MLIPRISVREVKCRSFRQMGRELKISIPSGFTRVLKQITPLFRESPSFTKFTKRYIYFNLFLSTSSAFKTCNRIKSHKRLIFTMCLYQRDAGNQKLFSFCEARLLFSRTVFYLAGYSILKEMKKIKRQGFGLAIFQQIEMKIVKFDLYTGCYLNQ